MTQGTLDKSHIWLMAFITQVSFDSLHHLQKPHMTHGALDSWQCRLTALLTQGTIDLLYSWLIALMTHGTFGRLIIYSNSWITSLLTHGTLNSWHYWLTQGCIVSWLMVSRLMILLIGSWLMALLTKPLLTHGSPWHSWQSSLTIDSLHPQNCP